MKCLHLPQKEVRTGQMQILKNLSYLQLPQSSKLHWKFVLTAKNIKFFSFNVIIGIELS